MAPIKQHRDAAAKNRDKTKRRKRPSEHANHLLYRCMGELCGDECEQEIQAVPGASSQRRNDMSSKSLQQQDMEMDDISSDFEDSDYVMDERERRRQPAMKAGRVNKVTAKKTPTKQIKDMPVQLGLQKAERYLCSALDFGVQAGYLTPKDAKGRVLRVASGLLQTTDTLSQEMHDDDADGVNESKSQRRHGKKSRSRSKRHGMKKRSANSRSRSRSKRSRHGRRSSGGRSRSANPNSEKRPPPSTGNGLEEQDDMGNDNSQQTTGSSSIRNDDDGKSVKSTKSFKPAPNNDSQTGSENKNKHDDNLSNDEESDDDDDDDTKK